MQKFHGLKRKIFAIIVVLENLTGLHIPKDKPQYLDFVKNAEDKFSIKNNQLEVIQEENTAMIV
jgi:hypothetical protein